MKISRSSRLNGEYRKEISEIIRTGLKNKHPDLKGLISITEADVAPDLKTAKIYVSIYDGNEAEKLRSFKILTENAGYIRHELAKVMRMRTVPVLTFLWDGSMAYGAKMDELFKKIHVNDGANDAGDADGEANAETNAEAGDVADEVNEGGEGEDDGSEGGEEGSGENRREV